MSGGALREFRVTIPRYFGSVSETVTAENHGKARYQAFLNIKDYVDGLKMTDIRVKLAATNPTPSKEG